MTRSIGRYQQRGVALLAALILMLAVVFSLSNIFYRHQIDVSRLTKMLHTDQALLLALSVENWAGQLLSTQQDDRDVDNLQEIWAIAVPALPVDGGFVRGCIVDLQSRINLNSFAAYDSERWSGEMTDGGNGLVKTWLSLLAYAELPHSEEFAVSIIDWVDQNTEPLNQWGAEQINYDSERMRRMVANTALTDVTELAVIKGYDLFMVQQLDQWVTALPLETVININTAERPLLLAMGGEYAEAFADFVLQNRPFYALNIFHQNLATFLDLTIAETAVSWPSSFVGVKSDYFQLSIQVVLGEAQIETHSIMSRYNRETPVIIKRDVIMIPAILPTLDDETVAETFCQNINLGT